MPPKYGEGMDNPMMDDVLTAGDVDAATYGVVDVPDGRKKVARLVPLRELLPDQRQPRRAIPSAVRLTWNGKPGSIPDMLYMWRSITEDMLLGADLNLNKMIVAKQHAPIAEGDVVPEIAQNFLDLISLAASIYHDGLTNPITVVERLGHPIKLIEAGERRVLAHHLLTLAVPEDEVGRYSSVPAFVRTGDVDPWKQAAENGARKPLSAIDMARQLALLVMDMYLGDAGVQFDDFDDLVLPGGCDRRFYAQVAHGNIFKIKPGYSQRILDVTGLKSTSQISQYRRLLDISDETWSKADDQGWSEFDIRQYHTAATPSKSDGTLTHVKVIPDLTDGNGSHGFKSDDPAIVPTVTTPTAQTAVRPVQTAGNTSSTNPDEDDDEDFVLSGSTPRAHGGSLDKPLPNEFDDEFEDDDGVEDIEPQSSMLPVKVYDTAPIIHEAGWTDANDLFLFLKKVASRTKTNPQLLSKMMDLLTYSEADLHRPGMSPEMVEGIAAVAYDLIDGELNRVRDEAVRFMKVLVVRSKPEAE